MDISPYLSALSKVYELKKLPEGDGMRVWRARKRGILKGEPFFLAVSGLFYLPENEHRMKEALSRMALPVRFSWQTPKVVCLCSYNGMVDLSRDDLRSFTKDALINYLLLERESGRWLGADTFYLGGSDEPARIRRILQAVSAELTAQNEMD